MSDPTGDEPDSSRTTCPYCGEPVGTVVVIGPTDALIRCGCPVTPEQVLDSEHPSADDHRIRDE